MGAGNAGTRPDRAGYWTLLKGVAALGIAAFLVYYAFENRETFRFLSGCGGAGLATATALLLAQALLQTLFVPLLGAPFGLRIRLGESVGLGFLSVTASNLMPLQAGLGLRAVYLKQRHELAYSSSLLMAVVQQITRIIACGILGLGVIIGMALSGRGEPFYVLAAIAPLALTLIPILWKTLPTPRQGRFQQALEDLSAGWTAIMSHRPVLAAAVGLHLVIMTTNALLFVAVFRCMGHDVSTLVMAAYTQVKYIANIVSLIPGNMGLSEVLTGYFAREMSIPFQQGVVVALVLRVASTLLSALGALAATSMGVRRPATATTTERTETLLYFGPSGIGDWCFIHESLPALLARCRCSHIDAVLPYRNEGNALLADNPLFAEVTYLGRVTRGPGLIDYGLRCFRLLLRLRRGRYRVLAISYLSTQPDFLLLAALSGIPERIGAFERPMGRLDRLAVNRPVVLEPGSGKVASHRQYAEGTEATSPGPPMFAPTLVSRGADLRDRLADAGPYVVLGIGGGRGASWRFWPAERYRALILANPHLRFVLLGGGEADRAQSREIGVGEPANLIDLVGKTTMPEALAILSGARGIVGNDSGLTNMAASLGTPSLTIYGPTDPDVSGAAVLGGDYLSSRNPEPCQPCYRDARGPVEALACSHRRCLTGIEIADVEAWLRALPGAGTGLGSGYLE